MVHEPLLFDNECNIAIDSQIISTLQWGGNMHMKSISIYTLLNLMSEKGIDAYRVVSVLGYCLLPMVAVGALSVVVTLE